MLNNIRLWVYALQISNDFAFAENQCYDVWYLRTRNFMCEIVSNKFMIYINSIEWIEWLRDRSIFVWNFLFNLYIYDLYGRFFYAKMLKSFYIIYLCSVVVLLFI